LGSLRTVGSLREYIEKKEKTGAGENYLPKI
jgi:hypothetical protein